MKPQEKINSLILQETFIVFKYNQNITFGKFLCDCGKITTTKLTSVASGHVKSCGCLRDKKAKERAKTLSLTHGQSKHRLYSIYNGMKNRCYNTKARGYKDYGGKGVELCLEWKNDFQVFYEWAINNGYQDNLTIDRKENNKNYCPENCRWETRQKQSYNRTDNVFVTAWGETKTIAEWLKDNRCKANRFNITYRISQNWSPELAITTPPLTKFKYLGKNHNG